jgi:hypothetical protein
LTSAYLYFPNILLDVMVFYFSDDIIRKASEDNKTAVENAFKSICSSNDNDFRDAVEGNRKNVKETYARLYLWGKALSDSLSIKFNLPELMDNHIIFNGFH